ncbi:sulfatase-like hydrolase/transferase [Natrinema halophilum]|uniref:Sulfatase-like hydrolase/transferase n=1 Tax=Natrinema halophilum TaxID=1699371 RepID=A0A7D5GI10_9EURY|nr:sulfatase-like hydrolase/transferase [Natrinema halophilum]QLG49347.1 sulfatase-like hydrolase/transferase [Natrinema halophilum]
MPDGKSVVLVTIDSFRTDYCGVAAGDSETMPTLAAHAEDGLVFENAIASGPATFESATSFLTGMKPVERPDAAGGGREETKSHVRKHMAARRSVAEEFSERGYETAAFTANPWTSRYFGFDDGFDHFEDFMDGDASSGLLEGGEQKSTIGTLAMNATNWWQGQDMFMSWEALADEITEWTAEAEAPYFLWVFLVDSHLPYLPPATYRTQSRLKTYPANMGLFLDRDLPFESVLHDVLTTAYENTLKYTDEFLSFLTEEVGTDPLFVVHGDHGEAFGEHGMYGHGRQLYEPLVNVPLVVCNGPSGRVKEPFSLSRLPALLGGLASGDETVPDRLTEPYVFSSNRMPSVAVRGRDWKYIWSPDEQELYDLTDGEDEELDDDDLRTIGQDLVDFYRGSQSEKERVVEAVSDLAESGRV